MDSEIELDDEDMDDTDFLDAQGNVIDRSVNTSKTPSVVATESSEENISRVGSQVSLQNVFKNLFAANKGNRNVTDPLSHAHQHNLGQAVTDANLRRSQGLSPANMTALSAAAGRSTEPDNLVARTDVIATCSESHPSFPLYLTGHNPALGYPCVNLWQFGQTRELNNYTGTSAKVTK
jgi:hypothetical protein